jgi:immune inhibitor A
MRLGALLAVVLTLSLMASSVLAAPAPIAPARAAKDNHGVSDNLKHPLAERQRALRDRALQARLHGRQPTNGVLQVGKNQFVELEREDEDSIWTVLGEFGDLAHNQIPKPDRKVDNSTIWQKDFSREYFLNLLFSEDPNDISMRNYYIEQSSGRYAVNGDVTDWVEIPGDAASYGNNECGDIVCQNVWEFVRDSVDTWYAGELAAGKTAAEIDEYLSQFDVWDRYDFDGDGDFDEPDGYIDHFQAVHAGEGEETGGGVLGEDAIWSHRWAVLEGVGETGPTLDDGTLVPFGGTPVGESKYWIGDYTIEPENGGVGVFAHEFAHDLGLPDLYDTSGNTGGAENSTGFWTLMSSGSYGNNGRRDIGTKPTHMGVWEKFQLGWLNYEVAFAGEASQHKLGPAEFNTNSAQALFVVLPDKEVQVDLGAPYAGSNFYYSGSGNDLDNLMYKEVALPAGAALTAKVRYQIEEGWDYAYVVVSDDGGATWTGVETNLSTDDDPHGQNFGNGITGSSGGEWVDLTADLSAYGGQTVLVGFRYWTDGAAVEPGFSIDEISIAGGAADGAETDGGWTFDPEEGGFRVTTGTETQAYFNAYVAENRGYRGYDNSLKTGPYNFGFLNTQPNWVEHFSYEDGLLISYWDSSYTDNSVGDHPGAGLLLPVDAHPELLHWSDGTLMRPRIQTYDSTFGLDRTKALTLHNNGVPTEIDSQPAVPVFDDTEDWWTDCDEHACTGEHAGRYQPGWNSVNVPKTGTQIEVMRVRDGGRIIEVEVRPAE